MAYLKIVIRYLNRPPCGVEYKTYPAFLKINVLIALAAIIKETGWKCAMYITIFEITLALIIGGIAFRVLDLFM